MHTCNDCYDNFIEDEYNFILVCKKYDNIRKAYIKPYYCRRHSYKQVFQILNLYFSNSHGVEVTKSIMFF